MTDVDERGRAVVVLRWSPWIERECSKWCPVVICRSAMRRIGAVLSHGIRTTSGARGGRGRQADVAGPWTEAGRAVETAMESRSGRDLQPRLAAAQDVYSSVQADCTLG